MDLAVREEREKENFCSSINTMQSQVYYSLSRNSPRDLLGKGFFRHPNSKYLDLSRSNSSHVKSWPLIFKTLSVFSKNPHIRWRHSSRHYRTKSAQKLSTLVLQKRLNSTSGNENDEEFVDSNNIARPNSVESLGQNSPTESSSNQLVSFPWRHESVLPARVLDHDDFSGMPNSYKARFIRRFVSTKELNLSFWNVLPIPFYTHEWELELTRNFTTAYVLALRELLQTIFQVPIITDYPNISIDSSVKKEILNESDDNHHDVVVSLQNNKYLNDMIDKNLLHKYQCIKSDDLLLKLSIRPFESKLQHIFTVPMLSREIVERKPHLKGGFQRIERAYAETKSYSKVKDMTYQLADEVGRDSYKRTVIAEATMRCMEFFQVKDSRSGEILQGMQDDSEEEEVVHIVRFEVVTDRGGEGIGRKIGNWKIIDWDDLLEGNVFH